MTFGVYVKKAWQVVQLDSSAMKSLAKDQKAFLMGVAIVALAGVAAAIGSFNPFGILIMPIIMVLLSFVAVGILHLLALLFGGKATYGELYNIMAHSAILNWVLVVPFLGMPLALLAGLWRMVVAVVALETVHQLSRGKAIAVVLIPVLVVIVLGLLTFSFMLAMMASFLGGSMMRGAMWQ
ncbi:YIP1 family protein [Candidatus Woesearchaeota archaeon]|nr:YIP1 family protein [Candidatus Woesearchaeota archaeon]